MPSLRRHLASRLGRRLPVLAILTILFGVGASARSPRGVEDTSRMCEGLPEFESLDRRIPRAASVIYRPAEGLDRAGERFFCARFALAPRLVSRPSWPHVTERIAEVAWTVDDDDQLTVRPPRGSR